MTAILKYAIKYDLHTKCKLLSCRTAIDEELELVHDPHYLKCIKKILSGEPIIVTDEAEKQAYMNAFGDSLYFNEYTLNAALLAAGGVIKLVDRVCEGKCKNGFAIVRYVYQTKFESKPCNTR